MQCNVRRCIRIVVSMFPYTKICKTSCNSRKNRIFPIATTGVVRPLNMFYCRATRVSIKMTCRATIFSYMGTRL